MTLTYAAHVGNTLSPLPLLPLSLPVHKAVGDVNEAIQSGSLTRLLQALQVEDSRLTGVMPENVQWYMDVLSKAIKDKAEVQ